jgi:mRNA-degrading endonuclease HigB of HigAB toxin-antitoxin module
VGSLNKSVSSREKLPTFLLGPGRWGTSTPSLGVPVSFFEINKATVLGELAFAGGNLMPELSLGTHFFQDLVESNIFYVALFCQKEEVIFNDNWFKPLKNLFEEIIPEAGKYKDIIKVYDVSGKELKIMSDIMSQKVICFAGK